MGLVWKGQAGAHKARKSLECLGVACGEGGSGHKLGRLRRSDTMKLPPHFIRILCFILFGSSMKG